MKASFISKIVASVFIIGASLFCKGQEQIIFLSDHIRSYNTFETNEEKGIFLSQLRHHVKNMDEDSLRNILSSHQKNFITRFAMAEYYRLNNNYAKANDAYIRLEQEVLEKKPVDYTLLGAIVWKSSINISLENFNFENELKDLYRGLGYAEKSNVNLQLLEFHSSIEYYNSMLANYEQSYYHNRKCYEIAIKSKDTLNIILSLKKLLTDFSATGDGHQALKIWSQIRPYFKAYQSNLQNPGEIYESVTDAYLKVGQLDSAAYYNKLGLAIDSIEKQYYRYSTKNFDKAIILLEQKQIEDAQTVLYATHNMAIDHRNGMIEAMSAIELSKLYLKQQQIDKAYDLLSLTYNRKIRIRDFYKGHLELMLSRTFEAKNVLDSALYYRNKSDVSLESERVEVAKKEVALARIELDVDSYIATNESLTESNEVLNQKVNTSTNTKNLLIYLVIAISIVTGFFIYRRNQKEKLRITEYKEQLTNKERMAIEAELNSIRSQMNPHFMFNSLNSINEFIQNDSSDQASNYLVKFSRLMRSTLNYSKRKFVSLKEEIDLLKLYLELESLRFYNSIDYTFDIDSSIKLDNLSIPPMMLQPFVENAIWHGLMAKDNDRKLALRFIEVNNNLMCEIEDNGIGRAASLKQNSQRKEHKSQGMGLTERRLELLKSIHGKEAGVQVIDLYKNKVASGTLVKVTLPKQQKHNEHTKT